MLSTSRNIFALLGLFTLLLIIALIMAPLYIYDRLEEETLAATITFKQMDKQTFAASYVNENDCSSEEFVVVGDQWQIDASFLKWKPWGSKVGLDPLYRLERLSGRYRNLEEQKLKLASADGLTPDIVADPFMLSTDNFLVDTIYGSSVYETMVDGGSYQVFAAPSGLFVRRIDSEGKALSMPACEKEEPGYFTKTVLFVNRVL